MFYLCKLYKYYLRKRRTRLLKGKVDIHPSAILLDSAYFDYRTEEESKRIFIDEESMIGCNFIFESDSGVIKIGKRTFINAGTNIISINEIEIGDDVTIGWNIYIYDHDSHSLAVSRIACGLQDHLELGNLDSLRDWGYAKDYVECMWLMLQHDTPEDFVIATGDQHTVRDFTEKAFKEVGINIRWEGTGINEKGYDVATGKMLVCVNEQWFRPTEVDNLWGDPTKAKKVLGWDPQKTSYEELIKIMVKHDYELAKREAAIKRVR